MEMHNRGFYYMLGTNMKEEEYTMKKGVFYAFFRFM